MSRARPVRRGVSKTVADGGRPPGLRAGHYRNGRKAVSGVAWPQGIEGSGMAGPGETLGSPWIPLAIQAIQAYFQFPTLNRLEMAASRMDNRRDFRRWVLFSRDCSPRL
jgi:hypothetical protein